VVETHQKSATPILHQLLVQPRLRAADLGKEPERSRIYVIYLDVPDPLFLKLGIAGPGGKMGFVGD
jgi:hypothetical protein